MTTPSGLRPQPEAHVLDQFRLACARSHAGRSELQDSRFVENKPWNQRGSQPCQQSLKVAQRAQRPALKASEARRGQLSFAEPC
eukprot:8648827-Pyramimonas_sp.AAC.1